MENPPQDLGSSLTSRSCERFQKRIKLRRPALYNRVSGWAVAQKLGRMLMPDPWTLKSWPFATRLLGFHQRSCIHTTNTTVLGRTIRPNLRCDCERQCSNATWHLEGILASLRHLPCTLQILTGKTWSVSLYVPRYFTVAATLVNQIMQSLTVPLIFKCCLCLC